MFKYEIGLFDVTVGERVTSVGVKVYINNVQLIGARGTGDFGGEPNMIDASCLIDEVDQSVLGRQSLGAWNCEYLYNDKDADGDFAHMEEIAAMKTSVPVKVEFPNGATFENTGTVSNYANGVEDNNVLRATVTVAIDGGKWKYTAPGGNDNP